MFQVANRIVLTTAVFAAAAGSILAGGTDFSSIGQFPSTRPAAGSTNTKPTNDLSVGLPADLATDVRRPSQAPAQAPGQPANPAASSTAAAVPGAATIEQIGATLEGMGYPTTRSADGLIYTLTVERGGYSIPVQFYLSANRQIIWVRIAISELHPGQSLPDDMLVRILTMQCVNSPTVVWYMRATNQIVLAYPFANIDPTAAVLRDRLERLVNCAVEEMLPLFNRKTAAAAPPTTQVPAPAAPSAAQSETSLSPSERRPI